MNPKVKQFLIRLVLHGGVFAILMAIFDALNDKAFSITGFLLRMLIFGFLMSLTFLIIDINKSGKSEKKQV